MKVLLQLGGYFGVSLNYICIKNKHYIVYHKYLLISRPCSLWETRYVKPYYLLQNDILLPLLTLLVVGLCWFIPIVGFAKHLSLSLSPWFYPLSFNPDFCYARSPQWVEEIVPNYWKRYQTQFDKVKKSKKKRKCPTVKFLTKRALNVQVIGRTFKPL